MTTTATIETNFGDMTLELYEEKVPNTVKNFMHLAQKGFYDGIIFHRVIKDFMIQCGCPEGMGIGGPGWQIADEFVKDLVHDTKGLLSMANAGPNTNGSQFFITLVETPWLDGRHTVFGRLIEGEDVLDKIGSTQTGMQDRPVEPIMIGNVVLKRDGEEITEEIGEPEKM
jgi:peptidyl-prolyl cis-trans isomerase A (cyclophilin A)